MRWRIFPGVCVWGEGGEGRGGVSTDKGSSPKLALSEGGSRGI